ncbi:hypothetical protein Pmar_PMAR000454 [Perkinsus marinus ATCC 50983]|uniref:CYTH domain-containing protein n=1 Tax=Perkinsus marinus (strain ATCC 50983 / TXsc) TaxID=423536 RepID=C5L4H6_PERM5|nr:hypothetical protein Pmar_PMAR000454 [Perkinsus marinus ATCC 50983]EER08413.1 hypothetical protein Pmar_PMAR000454 [Perkinsus marinus ATCC 50983]|eukprot:XP_002776597.1 hypothetical protein Pmar_PMAR000454 [Perkinsus marinus ATCC 50983]
MSATTTTTAAAARLEVERKIALGSSAELARFLSAIGPPVRRVVLHDTYWDDRKMTLVSDTSGKAGTEIGRYDVSKYLGKTNGYDSIPAISRGSHSGSSSTYNEVEGEASVKQFLFPSGEGTLRSLLEEDGFKVFAELVSHRATYHAVQDGRAINVDVDSATFPDDPVPYSIVELEVLSEASVGDDDGDTKVAASESVIDAFMERMGIAGKTVRPRSKLVEYLARHDEERLVELAKTCSKYRKIVCELMGSDWVEEHAPEEGEA